MSIRRIGLVGALPDPAAQLLEDLYPLAEFVPMADPTTDSEWVDDLFVLSQSAALTHLTGLMTSGKPSTILLRRHARDHEDFLWREGLALLVEILGRADWPDLTLAALTEEAAAEMTELSGLDIAPLPPLPPIPGPRPRVAIRPDDGHITFRLAPEGKPPEERRARLDIFNWARLRRLADVESAAPDALDLVDLTAFANGGIETAVAAAPAHASTSPAPTVLCVVPNGVGLGHITRMMAICTALKRQSGARVVFWSFSRAAEILQAAGFEVVLRQNIQHLDAHPPDWRAWETMEFASAIRHLRPSAVIYDGGTFDMFIINALKSPGCGHCGIVWVRRGMLRPDADAQLLEAEQYCDMVLEPGDLSVENDLGPTRMRRAQNKGFSITRIAPPVTLKPYLPAYPEKTARKKLGLGRGRHCLVSLGGAFGNWDRLRQQIVDQARAQRVRLVWAQSPLAAATTHDLGDARFRQFYPLSRYLSAFDGMITATGYNSYHELMLGYDGPVLLAPTNNERLDDQEARARCAGDRGWASVVLADEPEDQSEIIAGFMNQVRRREKIANRPKAPQGAEEMARDILQVCRRYSCTGANP